jgi:hypothetical protein
MELKYKNKGCFSKIAFFLSQDEIKPFLMLEAPFVFVTWKQTKDSMVTARLLVALCLTAFRLWQ